MSNIDAAMQTGKLVLELNRNVQALQDIFTDCADVIFRQLTVENGTKACLIYIGGLVETKELSDNALRPFIEASTALGDEPSPAKLLSESLLSVPSSITLTSLSDIVSELTEGSAVLLIDQCGDGTPFVLSGPITFWQLMHSSIKGVEAFLMKDFAPVVVLIVLALVSEWKGYKSAATANRWFAAALYTASILIWVWMTSRPDLPRPGNWIDGIFR